MWSVIWASRLTPVVLKDVVACCDEGLGFDRSVRSVSGEPKIFHKPSSAKPQLDVIWMRCQIGGHYYQGLCWVSQRSHIWIYMLWIPAHSCHLINQASCLERQEYALEGLTFHPYLSFYGFIIYGEASRSPKSLSNNRTGISSNISLQWTMKVT